ncbi:MAG: tryptophan 2,3-dioxygenase [Planctomycetes bacterium]|nr:tryptophan 2,3-dioxygenase [Planctomycetota bacterium]
MSENAAEYDKLVLEKLNYNSYLRVPELLGLQRPQSDPEHHDEMFFIIIHQSFELWFKEMLHETGLLMEYFRAGQVSRALKVVKRVNAILETLCQQIQLLSTLTPVEFAGFRKGLGTGSGFQSVQFREVEFAFGLRDEWFFQFFEDDDFARGRLRKRFEGPSVYDEFLRALARDGYAVPGGLVTRDTGKPHELDPGLVECLRKLYLEPEDNYHWILVCEALLDLDTLFSKWRAVHVLMVSRTIGGQKGTGGSSGRAFLESRMPYRFFPELWEVRNRFWADEEGGAY